MVGVQIASDEVLARRAADGDESAFEELVVRYQDRLYTLALRITLSDADAYDCVQEGLVSAWRGLRQLPLRRPLLDLDPPDRRAQGLRRARAARAARPSPSTRCRRSASTRRPTPASTC